MIPSPQIVEKGKLTLEEPEKAIEPELIIMHYS